MLKFAKPKGPGFGLNKQYYLSVLSTRPAMPSLLQVLNPKGEDGAVIGMGVPLAAGTSKDDLQKPLQRGAYALATKDRKTVVKLLVMSSQEAGFDPDMLARSKLAASLDQEVLLRIKSTWSLAQATFEAHDPMVYPAVRFHLSVARRLAELTDGVVADPISQRYLLPHQTLHSGTTDSSTDARDLVAVLRRTLPEGTHAYTLGLQKLALPEIEISGLAPDASPLAVDFLLGVVQGVLSGKLLDQGAEVGSRSLPFEVGTGGLDRGLWEGIPVFELLPAGAATTTDALEAWAAERNTGLA